MTQIRYQLPLDAYVTLKVFNILGEEVRTLVDKFEEAGHKSVEFSTGGESTNYLPSGVYLYRLQAGSFVDVRKMILIK